MKTSPVGLDLIKTWEGLRLKAYKDPIGVITVGYGHTKGIELGDVITTSMAEQFLMEDLRPIELKLSKVYPNIHQLMFDALSSFSFNLGTGWMLNSGLAKAMAARDFQKAADEFLRWNKAGGKVLPGLTARRSAERDLFLQGYHRSLEL